MAKRLVIFVEGEGDAAAMPPLAQRVVSEIGAHDALYVDPEPYRAKGVATLVKDNCRKWHNWLQSAGKTRPNLGAVLLVLDGDLDRVPPYWSTYTHKFGTSEFCAHRTAAMLGEEARTVRAGEMYSVASVFVMKEFETWLLGGIESLRGKSLAGARGIVPMNATCPAIDLERKRDAEGELRKIIPLYSKSLDQGVLAREVDLEVVRNRCRSFRRFCSAVQQLADAIRSGQHVVTPPVAA